MILKDLIRFVWSILSQFIPSFWKRGRRVSNTTTITTTTTDFHNTSNTNSTTSSSLTTKQQQQHSQLEINSYLFSNDHHPDIISSPSLFNTQPNVVPLFSNHHQNHTTSVVGDDPHQLLTTFLIPMSNNVEFHKCDASSSYLLPSSLSPSSSSKYQAMRIKKHFTASTNLLIRELNTPHFVGSFANSTELKAIRKSPLSFLPFQFLSQLFSRNEYMLVKSAILVFITASLDQQQQHDHNNMNNTSIGSSSISGGHGSGG